MNASTESQPYHPVQSLDLHFRERDETLRSAHPHDGHESPLLLHSQMQACDRPGSGRYIAAFYSDDYFLRPWVVNTIAYNGYRSWGAVTGPIDATTIAEQSRILPDGRVAVLRTFEGNADYGQLIVFIEQDGNWLIGEYEEVTQSGRFVGG